jgi:hypothetical protein
VKFEPASQRSGINQGGGFDVVFIEVDPDDGNHIHVRCGQVTKSASSHKSLKLQYLSSFLALFKDTSYEVVSVEIAFIVPLHQIKDFQVTSGNVIGSGLLSHSLRA